MYSRQLRVSMLWSVFCQMADIMQSSDGQLEQLRHEIRSLKAALSDVENDRDKVKVAVTQAREQTGQLQDAAQFTEKCLIVAETVIRRERCAAAFRAWENFVIDRHVQRAAAQANAASMEARISEVIEEQTEMYVKQQEDLRRQLADDHSHALEEQHRRWIAFGEEQVTMACEDGLGALVRLCAVANSRHANTEQLWMCVSSAFFD